MVYLDTKLTLELIERFAKLLEDNAVPKSDKPNTHILTFTDGDTLACHIIEEYEQTLVAANNGYYLYVPKSIIKELKEIC